MMRVMQALLTIVRLPSSAKKRTSRIRPRGSTLPFIACRLLIIWLLTALAAYFNLSYWFLVLLPVTVSTITIRPHLYNRSSLLIATCLALLYFGGITIVQTSLYHFTPPEIVVVTTTLSLAVLFEPVRSCVQRILERLLHLRHEEVTSAISSFTSTLREEVDLEQVRKQFLDVVQKTIQPESVSVWLDSPAQDTTDSSQKQEALQMQTQGNIPAIQQTTNVSIASGDPFVEYLLQHDDAVEIDQLELESPLLVQLKEHNVEVVQPLISQGELLGLLNLGPRVNRRDYTHEEHLLLNTLAAQVAPALRVGQTVQVQQLEVRERTRIEQELQTAQQIQQSLLPEEVPTLAGWHFVPYYQPAREVGGDFYDFLTFEDGQLGLLIGDVTGKGIPAALMMTTVCTMLRTLSLTIHAPGEVLARVNDLLCARMPSGMFVTCFYLKLDPTSGSICYASAGHDWPFRHWPGHVSELQVRGMPLGMMPGMCYEEQQGTLEPGESILLYSDGLVEAHNAQQEMFGLPRLKALLEGHPGKSSLIDFLLDQLASFTGDDWVQEDDVTMVYMHRDPLSTCHSREEHPTHYRTSSETLYV